MGLQSRVTKDALGGRTFLRPTLHFTGSGRSSRSKLPTSLPHGPFSPMIAMDYS